VDNPASPDSGLAAAQLPVDSPWTTRRPPPARRSAVAHEPHRLSQPVGWRTPKPTHLQGGRRALNNSRATLKNSRKHAEQLPEARWTTPASISKVDFKDGHQTPSLRLWLFADLPHAGTVAWPAGHDLEALALACSIPDDLITSTRAAVLPGRFAHKPGWAGGALARRARFVRVLVPAGACWRHAVSRLAGWAT